LHPNTEGANNYPLRSGKFSSFEGGMRVTSFLGGGFLPQAVRGTATTQLMHVADIWGTLAEAIGHPIADPIADSVGLPPLVRVSFLLT
jgi:arylsulfatase A-like enzyme